MSDLATLYERNAEFSRDFAHGDLPVAPQIKTIVLSCVDARTDPGRYLGLELGDALVLRTVGARLTEAALLEVSILWQLMKMGAGGATPQLGLAIIHHEGCGMARFAIPEVAEVVTAAFGSSHVVDTYAITDPRTSVAADVNVALTSGRAPSGLTVSGHVYSVESGTLEQVVGPTTVA